jgi:hypothetical protein
VEEAGRRRAEEGFEDLAAALGVSADRLRKFQLERAVTELRVVGDATGKGPAKIASPLRKPVSRVLPKGAKGLRGGRDALVDHEKCLGEHACT